MLGAVCRAIADCIMYPSRVLKVRKQGKGHKNTSLISIIQNEGAGALYSGLSIEVARGTLSAGLMLTVKEKIAVLVRALVLAARFRGTRRAQRAVS